MKIAHIADAHWGLGYPGPKPESRFEDITNVMDWAAEKIIESNCELVLFAGDAFKDAKVMLDRATPEIMAFVKWLRKLSNAGIPVVVISGTPSHDAVSAYELIREMAIPGVQIMTRPGIAEACGWKVACLPGLNRSQIVTREEFRTLQPHEIHRIMTEKLRDMCWGLKAKGVDVLLSHMTLAGSDTGFDDFLMEHEPVLSHEAVSHFPLVCLGHIHRPQSVPVGSASMAYYSGAPERHSFNDEAVTPGFWIHDTEKGQSEFIETPARPFLTIDIHGMDSQIFQAFTSSYGEGWDLFDSTISLKNAMVRVRWACTEEQAAQVDRKALEASLYAAGAFFVTEIRLDAAKSERSRDSEVTESLGPVQAVERWGFAHGKTEGEIGVLQSLTARLVEEVRS
ncbi:metallophosphoesterase family protein [Aminirod propionatiphilus]|uniref:Metallophosphoesterase family protein n=1 Tax=Aminirod propionatiphilus TaxID=3415223 RepID=A0ACD1DY91_9BACT|nr:metallophosphoesterase family protein [Synergistota bacterium]